MGTIRLAEDFSGETIEPCWNNVKDGAPTVDEGDTLPMPVSAAHVDGRLFGVDVSGDCGDGGVRHGVGRAGVRLDVNELRGGFGEGNTELFEDFRSLQIHARILLGRRTPTIRERNAAPRELPKRRQSPAHRRLRRVELLLDRCAPAERSVVIGEFAGGHSTLRSHGLTGRWGRVHGDGRGNFAVVCGGGTRQVVVGVWEEESRPRVVVLLCDALCYLLYCMPDRHMFELIRTELIYFALDGVPQHGGGIRGCGR